MEQFGFFRQLAGGLISSACSMNLSDFSILSTCYASLGWRAGQREQIAAEMGEAEFLAELRESFHSAEAMREEHAAIETELCNCKSSLSPGVSKAQCGQRDLIFMSFVSKDYKGFSTGPRGGASNPFFMRRPCATLLGSEQPERFDQHLPDRQACLGQRSIERSVGQSKLHFASLGSTGGHHSNLRPRHFPDVNARFDRALFG